MKPAICLTTKRVVSHLVLIDFLLCFSTAKSAPVSGPGDLLFWSGSPSRSLTRSLIFLPPKVHDGNQKLKIGRF